MSSHQFDSASNANLSFERTRWPPSRIFVKVEFGVAFSPTKQHTISFSYPSRCNGASDQQKAEARGRTLTSRRDKYRFRFRSRSSSHLGHEFGILSAPQGHAGTPFPLFTDYRGLLGPSLSWEGQQQSVLEYYGPRGRDVRERTFGIQGYVPESYQQSQYNDRVEPTTSHLPSINSRHHPNSFPVSRRLAIPQSPQRLAMSAPVTPVCDKPLPPLPSAFRLGEEDLPWSSPTWGFADDTFIVEPDPSDVTPPRAPSEDPQRIQDLEVLQQAMLSVDSMEADWWDAGEAWDTQGDLAGMPRGPRSLGWAIRVDTSDEVSPLRTAVRRLSDGIVPSTSDPPPAYSMAERQHQ